MPYIKESRRNDLDLHEGLPIPTNAGELNYLITKLAIAYLEFGDQGISYERLNAAVGAIESAKAEFQRRVVTPYEDRKIVENGDVYPSWMVP